MTLGVAGNADGADANVGPVNCMTAENLRACHSSSLGPRAARADSRECRADASLA